MHLYNSSAVGTYMQFEPRNFILISCMGGIMNKYYYDIYRTWSDTELMYVFFDKANCTNHDRLIKIINISYFRPQKYNYCNETYNLFSRYSDKKFFYLIKYRPLYFYNKLFN